MVHKVLIYSTAMGYGQDEALALQGLPGPQGLGADGQDGAQGYG